MNARGLLALRLGQMRLVLERRSEQEWTKGSGFTRKGPQRIVQR